MNNQNTFNYQRISYKPLLLPKVCNNEVVTEVYSKRLNLLIHEVDESKDSGWETREVTVAIFERFFKEGFDLTPDKIQLIDIHRLPQRLVIKHG